MGHLNAAAELHRKGLEAKERTLGPDHPDTVASMNNLANVFAKLGRFPEAAALHHRAWTLRRQTLGLEHPDAQMSQRNLAVVLKILGKDGEAAEILSASTEKLGRLQLVSLGK
eukprot:symbB.v1.2.035785.t1/scaffold4901.1/size52642/4